MDIKYSQSEKNDDSVFGQTENVPMKSLEHLPRQFIGKELMLFEMVGILNGKITELEQKISKMQKNETVNTETIQKISEAEYDQSKSLVGVELKQREVNVNEMISDVVESSKIESKLPILLGLDHDVVILADKISMTKVIQTILTNSIKATKNGHIKVESFVAYDQNVFILRIYDTGCGIPKEVLPNIFEKTHIDKNSNEGNTLSWCKKIIKLHDGKISAKNNDKGGATFTITLPIKKD